MTAVPLGKVAALSEAAAMALGSLGYSRLTDLSALSTDAAGSYVLVIQIGASTHLVVGRLGGVELQPGVYAYSGSAMRGLRARIARHLRSEKRRHWHVDYLLDLAAVVGVWVRVGEERMECIAAEALAGSERAGRPIAGFGSSDCRCRSHLIAWTTSPSA